jgi:hypothetical protein
MDGGPLTNKFGIFDEQFYSKEQAASFKVFHC